MPNASVDSVVTPLALLFLVVMAVWMAAAPRRTAIVPLFFTTILMTLAQQIVVAGCHFTFVRILILVGLSRVCARGEAKGFRRTQIDKVFLWWVAVTFVTGMLLDPSHDQLVNRSGFVFDALGIYFLVRFLVRDLNDVAHAVCGLIILCAVLACFMTEEKLTGRNL